MSQITVLYTPTTTAQSPVEWLRTIVGAELALGWSITESTPVDGSQGAWRVNLEHESEGVARSVRELIAAAADRHFELYRDEVIVPWHAAEPVPEPIPAPAPEPPPVLKPLSLDLPYDIPAILAGSEAGQRKRAAIRGVLAGILLSAALGLLSPSGTALRQMFSPTTPSAAVPTGILCLFFWGIMLGLDRRRRLGAIDSLNGPALLPAIISGLQTHGVTALDQALRGDVVRHSPLLRRIHITLEQWLIRPSLQNASLAIEQQVISDRETTQRGYNLLRLFVWATPVLGLIGTVVGISIAVGGFANFLSTDVEDVAKIKSGLVGVTGGLSFAFLITLEGLLSSLILMLFTSSIQTREERIFAGIEQDVAERFLPELQRVSPEQNPGAVAQGPGDWSEEMAEASRKVMAVIDAAGKEMLAKWDERHRSHVSDLATVRKTVEESAQHVETTFENASAAMGTRMAQSVAAMLEGAGKGFESCNSEINRATQTVVLSMNQATGDMGTQLKSVVTALDATAASHRTATEQANADSRQALAGYAADVTRASEAVIELGKVTRQVLESQAALQVAMAQLGDSRLTNTLSELDSSLKDLKPVLSNLSQPFVLQAVPVPARSVAASGGD